MVYTAIDIRMDDKARSRVQLDCLYEMFRDRIEENVVYIVFSENDGKIDTTIDQLMSIAACSFTGHQFEPQISVRATKPNANCVPTTVKHPGDSSANTKRVLSPDSNGRVGNKKFANDLNKDSIEKDDLSTSSGIVEDDIESTIEERIERLQRSIDDLLAEKKNSHDKASQYLSKKMYPVTSYYSELTSQFRKMIEDKTNKLVDLLLQRSDNSNYIDLHGLNPIQARLVVSELLKIRQDKLQIDKQGEATIDIITGWGKHKITHGHRIRPTIVSLLRENGYEYHHLNKGALRVTIRR